MEIIDSLSLLLFILTCLDGFTGIYLIIKGIQRKIYNIIILGIGFVSATLSLLLVVIFNISWNFVAPLLMLGFLLIIPFTQRTFHKKQKQPYTIIYCIAIFVFILKIIYALFDEYSDVRIYEWLSIIFEIILTFICFGWLGKSALDSYKIIEYDTIEPWIKKRIRILGIASWAMAFQGLPQILMPIFQTIITIESPITIAVLTITIILTTIFAFGNIIVWFMPNFLKKYFNQGYSTKLIPDSSKSEEEIMNHLREGN